MSSISAAGSVLQAVHSKFWTDLPVPMKNATGVFLGDTLYFGGGYTGNTKTDSIVYAWDFTAGKWRKLPPSPLKYSTVTALGGKLVLVGGWLTQGAKLACYTNKVAVWNADTQGWGFPLAPMMVSRMAPVVISVDDNLIAAGGRKGSLDYQAEVLHAKVGKWVRGPPLPLRCLNNTSAVVGEEWYLANVTNGIVQCANIRDYVTAATRHLSIKGAPTADIPHPLWKRLPCNPPVIPFRIASINSQLVAFSDPHHVNITVHMYMYQQEIWAEIVGKFPCVFSTGSLLECSREENTLYVLGGEVGQQYSNQAHKLNLMTRKSLKVMKKSRQTTF